MITESIGGEDVGGAASSRQLEVIQQWTALGRPEGLRLHDAIISLAKRVGITSLQSYVHWSEIERSPGVFSYDYYDPLVERIKENGLKWVPFIIAGPFYSTPEWFRESEESVFASCLEHDQDTVIQSIWNPNLPKRVEGFLKDFATHYNDPSIFESILIGISGNWGESIYPAGGGFEWDPAFHTHRGWWCGDEYAEQHYREWLKAKYSSIDVLNGRWGTNYRSFDEVRIEYALVGDTALYPRLKADGVIVPDSVLRQGLAKRVQYLDFTEWYFDSMNKWMEFWLEILRQYYPDVDIYVVTGGAGEVMLGADFSMQAKIAAKYNAGIRITNQGDDFAFSYALTRLVAASCRNYGTYFSTEPAGYDSQGAIAGRMFNAVSSGAKGIYFKNLFDTLGRPSKNILPFLDNLDFLKVGNAQIDAAVLFANTGSKLDHTNNYISKFLNSLKVLRQFENLDIVDENMILDGMLDSYDVLIQVGEAVIQEDTYETIVRWIEKGGHFVISRREPIATLDRFVFQYNSDVRIGDGAVTSIAAEAFTHPGLYAYGVLDVLKKTVHPKRPVQILDYGLDGVYVSFFDGCVLFYNDNDDKEVTKQVQIGSVKKEIKIRPKSIAKLDYETHEISHSKEIMEEDIETLLSWEYGLM